MSLQTTSKLYQYANKSNKSMQYLLEPNARALIPELKAKGTRLPCHSESRSGPAAHISCQLVYQGLGQCFLFIWLSEIAGKENQYCLNDAYVYVCNICFITALQ